MKILSWNINSIRLRFNLLQKISEISGADIIFVQETKVEDKDFPLAAVKSLGFDHVEFSGQKSYNGVAILSKFPLKKIDVIDVLEYGHKRHISALVDTKIGEVALHNFYVPAGGDIPDPALNDKFDHKLKFLDWMKDFFSEEKKAHEKIILAGDLNIAPLPNDVWSHKQMLKVVSHTEIEVEKLNALQKTINFVDTQRVFVSESEKLYSWWSYRALAPLESNRGRRLDHIFASPSLKKYVKATKIYRDFRLEKQPSDHVPIETEFDFTK